MQQLGSRPLMSRHAASLVMAVPLVIGLPSNNSLVVDRHDIVLLDELSPDLSARVTHDHVISRRHEVVAAVTPQDVRASE